MLGRSETYCVVFQRPGGGLEASCGLDRHLVSRVVQRAQNACVLWYDHGVGWRTLCGEVAREAFQAQQAGRRV